MSKLEGTLFKQSSYNSGPEGENSHTDYSSWKVIAWKWRHVSVVCLSWKAHCLSSGHKTVNLKGRI